MYNSLKKQIITIIFIGFLGWFGYATGTVRDDDPIRMIDKVAQAVNYWDRIQDTAINDTTNIQWQYASEYKITNTLDSLRIQIAPYLQWTMYIGLSLAVIGIIYNGFLMVTKPLWSDGSNDKVKNRIMNIVTWVFILTWFYIIIQIILAIISYIIQ